MVGIDSDRDDNFDVVGVRKGGECDFGDDFDDDDFDDDDDKIIVPITIDPNPNANSHRIYRESLPQNSFGTITTRIRRHTFLELYVRQRSSTEIRQDSRVGDTGRIL